MHLTVLTIPYSSRKCNTIQFNKSLYSMVYLFIGFVEINLDYNLSFYLICTFCNGWNFKYLQPSREPRGLAFASYVGNRGSISGRDRFMSNARQQV